MTGTLTRRPHSPHSDSHSDTADVAFNFHRGHPWAALGTKVTSDMDIDTALELIGCGDEVIEQCELFSQDDGGFWDNTPAVVYNHVPDYVGIRSSVYGVMSVVSPKYSIMDRRSLLTLAYQIVGLSHSTASIEVIGNIGDKGQVFFAYLRVPDLVIDPSGICDTIERGLLVGNSYNYSMQRTFGFTALQLACSNAIEMTLRKGLQQRVSAKNTHNAEERLQEAAATLGYSGAVDEVMKSKALTMLKIPGDRALNNVMDAMWPIDDDTKPATKTRRENVRDDVWSLYNGPDNLAVDRLGRNGWAAYAAVTDWLDHAQPVRGVKDGSQVRARAERVVLPGPTVNHKMQAAKLIMATGN